MAAGASQSPLVSVIIPAYQASAHIAATLESVRRQTLRDIEILVVDDGSTDETPEIVARVAATDPRVRLISQANAGVAAARNRGIEEARAPYVAPVDADDVWKAAKLELQLAAIEEASAAYVLAYSWFVPIDTEGNIAGPLDFRPAIAGDAIAAFTMQNLVGASSPLLRRSVVEDVGGYDPSLRVRGGQGSEDWKLFVQMAAAGPVTVVPRFLMGYRRVPGSMSRDLQAALSSHFHAVADIRATHTEIPAAAFLWSELIHATFMARTYWREGSRASGARLLVGAAGRGLRQDPFLPFRSALRWNLRMRLGRQQDARRITAESPSGLPFLDTDLSYFEAVPRPRLERARDQFVATVIGTG